MAQEASERLGVAGAGELVGGDPAGLLAGLASRGGGEPGVGPSSVPGQNVTYSFPIEVEIVGGLGPQQKEEIAQHIYEELEDAFRGRS